MRDFRASYEPQEDATLLAIVKEAQDNGLPLAAAYTKAADELGRPVGSVSNRYRRLAAKDGNGEIKYRTNKIVSESERLALKLKALKRDRERSIEKTDMYKEKYDELQSEFDDLKRKYRTLETEHTKLIQTVKEALGEDLAV
jgi:uncharacterized coiled-coil DUF342 family protein